MSRRVKQWNPNTAAWLVSSRGSRTQDQVIADLSERGVAITRSWLSRIENGEPFGAELLAVFEDYYQSRPLPYEPPISERPAEPTAALIAALRDQTEAIRALVEELRVHSERQVGATEGLATVAGRMVAALEQSRTR